MLRERVALNCLLMLGTLLSVSWSEVFEQADEFGTELVAAMRNDANLDLSVDEEYEDLRAELLAYHTALASLSAAPKRRSMLQTPCWSLGGICIDHRLCTGFRSLTEVPGCKGRLMVCCFAWNKYKVKDWRDKGFGTPNMPWSKTVEFGGRGVLPKSLIKGLPLPKKKAKLSKKQKLNHIEGQLSTLEEEYGNGEDVKEEKSAEGIQEEMGANIVGVLGGNNTDAVAFILRRNK